MTTETASTEAQRAAIDVGDEDGYVDVTFNGQGLSLDLVSAWEKFLAHAKLNRGRDDYVASLVELAQQVGLPAMSQRATLRFFHRLSELITEVRDKDGIFSPAGPEVSPDPEPTLEMSGVASLADAVNAMNGMRDELRSAAQTVQEASAAP